MARSSMVAKGKQPKKAAKVEKAAVEAASTTKPAEVVSEASTSKSKSKLTHASKKSEPEPESAEEDEEDWEDEDVDSDDDSEDDGVDEEGMERLMKALGKDALDEFDQAQLEALAESDDEEDDESGDEDSEDDGGEEVSGDEEGEDEEAELSGEEEDDQDEEEAHEEEQDEEDEEGVPWDEIQSVDDDAVPRQKVEIDNTEALEQIRESFRLDPDMPWTETLSLSYPHAIEVDVNDDLNRELAFYKQALHGANAARVLAEKHKLPFTRPSDYFAEMVKSDAHMERIRQRLLNEGAAIKKSEDKRKEREGKKFGKQVQVEKLKERERAKKEMEEKLKGLKRKRKDVLDNPKAADDDFDIAVKDAIADRPSKRGKGSDGKGIPRSVRDKKYGFGGSTNNRRSKQNTRESTDSFGPSGGRGGRGGFSKGGRGGRGGGGGRGGRGGGGGGRGGGSKRPGKSKRMSAKSRS